MKYKNKGAGGLYIKKIKFKPGKVIKRKKKKTSFKMQTHLM